MEMDLPDLCTSYLAAMAEIVICGDEVAYSRELKDIHGVLSAVIGHLGAFHRDNSIEAT